MRLILINEINFALASRIVLPLNALVLYIVRGSLVYAYVRFWAAALS
jgi:hypothetical protein